LKNSSQVFPSYAEILLRREFPSRGFYGLTIGPITGGSGSLYAAVMMIRRAEMLLNEAVADVQDGEIVDAALKVMEARTQAGAGAGLARAAQRVSDSILDILA